MKHFTQKTIILLVLTLAFSAAGYSQNRLSPNNSILERSFSPLFVAAYKSPPYVSICVVKPFTLKPRKHELMYWPNYPLTPAQIEASEQEWERRNKKILGGQIVSDIADDIIKTQVNSLSYGKKKPVAVIPKF